MQANFDPRSFLNTLPSEAGIYRMVDAQGRVLYVGKARDIKKRVSSYFRAPQQLAPKTRALMSHTHGVEITVTHTETEALLLENNLIKEHLPRYNILLRDDKSFPYIYLATHLEFPRLAFHRGAKQAKGRYFGPFASAGAVRETLGLLQKLFRVRQCEESFFRNRSRPCLQYQIKRCTAPCTGLIGADGYASDVRLASMFLEGRSDQMIEELAKRMEAAASRLEYEQAGRYRDQIVSLRKVQARQYVAGARGDVDVVAALCQDGIAVVEVFVIRNGHSLGSKSLFPRHATDATPKEVLQAFLPQYYLATRAERPVPREVLINHPIDDLQTLEDALGLQARRRVRIRHRVRSERARWVGLAVCNGEVALKRRLQERGSLRERFEALQEVLDLDDLPSRIECFDVSHTGGKETVASCVVFDLGGAVKADYRHFNIKDIAPGDDYGAMNQALRRRYTRLQKEEGRLPDILLVDGGRGQLRQAREILSELQVQGVHMIGVAKGEGRKPGLEKLYLAGRAGALKPKPDSPALHLIQQVRDEAHRFAITGHRARRKQARSRSVLEYIPGIGPKRRRRLLREFGGLQGLARAGVEDLARVSGISHSLARSIYDAFRSD